MSTEKTEKLALHRWVAEDLFLRTEFNENFTAIDRQFSAVDDRLATHGGQHGAEGADPITPAMIGAASNPNLLDNWYFADPVDQRQGYVVPPDTPYYSDTALTTQAGTTTAYLKATAVNSTYGTITVSNTTYYVAWSAAVRGYAGTGYTGYTVDRWKNYNSKATTLVMADALRITRLTTPTYNEILLHQTFKSSLAEFLAGETVTLSILTGDVVGNHWMMSFGVTNFTLKPNTLNSFVYTAADIKLLYLWNSTSAAAGDFIDIKAVKLELGSTQTLAHQDEDGNWVLNDPPPDKGLELLKCITSTADASDAYANKTIATVPVTGTYTGTGAARIIKVGGSGKVCMVWSGTHYAFVNENGFVYIWSSEGLSSGSGGVESAAKSITFADGVLSFAASTVYPTGYAFMNQAGTTYNYRVL